MQHVGSTTDSFRYHWNNYKDDSKKAERGVEHMQADLFEHFAFNGHNGVFEDCTITLIDKTDGADATRRGILEKGTENCVTLWVEYCSVEVPYSCPAFKHFSEARVLLL